MGRNTGRSSSIDNPTTTAMKAGSRLATASQKSSAEAVLPPARKVASVSRATDGSTPSRNSPTRSFVAAS
ncbi:hypothetical protein ACH40E_43885 [Streptomyces acidicola]|uniref:hypothetical protein n=1 Tax=Streptomyces acidicola TaxID=2596892 RepID=UPI00379A2EDC